MELVETEVASGVDTTEVVTEGATITMAEVTITETMTESTIKVGADIITTTTRIGVDTTTEVVGDTEVGGLEKVVGEVCIYSTQGYAIRTQICKYLFTYNQVFNYGFR